MERIREYLKLAGKGERVVAAILCSDPRHCLPAVRHLRRGAPGVPVWLFATAAPPEEAARLCERVVVDPDSMSLALRAQQEVWPFRVALCVTLWTGDHGRWPVKLAAFVIPPFRVLVMNAGSDFFSATPAAVARHLQRALRDGLHSGWNRLRDLHRGFWLSLFAWIAQWFSGLSRYAFQRWHGADPLELPAVASAGDGVEVFSYAGRRWDREQLRRVIDESNSRWILFLENRDPVAIDAWLPLFEDPRTFAVSLQTRRRGWHPGLFPVAPFRQLQPGEATEVLAPVSPVILVDREKLRALGMQQTAVPGSAWYLWFWQAAAAGWRSYCAGSHSEVDDVTEWPYEEAEFVSRVLTDPALRRLGPRESSLARGNIGFSLPPRRAGSGRARVLVVSPYQPYPLAHGGAVRIYNLCRALAPRADFLLAAFREERDAVHYDELHHVFREVYAVDFDERASADPALPKQVREHASGSMAALIEELRRARRVDLVQIEYTHLARFREPAGERALLVEHDLTFTLYEQLGQSDEAARWRALERAAFREYTGIWTMSDEDRARALAEGASAERTFAIPNGVDVARFQPAGAPADTPEVLYVGSFRHLPNVLGYKKLRDRIMPSVWQRVPQAVLRVVAGPDPDKYHAETGRDKRIALHGFMEDLRPLYRSATVVAVPLVVSAGTNIKVMEAMACGRAVVSTPIGCVGLGLIDGYDACIREDDEVFADAVIELLLDPSRRDRIAAEARRTVEQRFSWDAIADAAFASYERLW